MLSYCCCFLYSHAKQNIYTIAEIYMPKPIYILNGPNLNLLGKRQPEIYGHETLADIEAICAKAAKKAGYDIVFKQSNIEGEIVDHIQEAGQKGTALIINPAAYTHTSVALHDAIKATNIPAVGNTPITTRIKGNIQTNFLYWAGRYRHN